MILWAAQRYNRQGKGRHRRQRERFVKEGIISVRQKHGQDGPPLRTERQQQPRVDLASVVPSPWDRWWGKLKMFPVGRCGGARIKGYHVGVILWWSNSSESGCIGCYINLYIGGNHREPHTQMCTGENWWQWTGSVVWWTDGTNVSFLIVILGYSCTRCHLGGSWGKYSWDSIYYCCNFLSL